jgi:hypothetical protein
MFKKFAFVVFIRKKKRRRKEEKREKKEKCRFDETAGSLKFFKFFPCNLAYTILLKGTLT